MRDSKRKTVHRKAIISWTLKRIYKYGFSVTNGGTGPIFLSNYTAERDREGGARRSRLAKHESRCQRRLETPRER